MPKLRLANRLMPTPTFSERLVTGRNHRMLLFIKNWIKGQNIKNIWMMKIIRLSGGPRLIPSAYADDETNKMVLFFYDLEKN